MAGASGRASVCPTEGAVWAELKRLGGQDPGQKGVVAVRLARGVWAHCGGLEGPGSWGQGGP